MLQTKPQIHDRASNILEQAFSTRFVEAPIVLHGIGVYGVKKKKKKGIARIFAQISQSYRNLPEY